MEKVTGIFSQCNTKDILGPRRSVQAQPGLTLGMGRVKQTGLEDLSFRLSDPCQSWL